MILGYYNWNIGCVPWVCNHTETEGAQFEIFIHSQDKV